MFIVTSFARETVYAQRLASQMTITKVVGNSTDFEASHRAMISVIFFSLVFWFIFSFVTEAMKENLLWER